MSTPGCYILKYKNPNFNEEAMVRKIQKNVLSGLFTYWGLYDALKEERDNCLKVVKQTPSDILHAKRMIELEDQMLFMADNAKRFGVAARCL